MMKKEERDAVLGDCMRGSVFTLNTNRLVQRSLRGYFQKEQHSACQAFLKMSQKNFNIGAVALNN